MNHLHNRFGTNTCTTALCNFPVVISLIHTSLPVLPQPTNTTHSTETYRIQNTKLLLCLLYIIEVVFATIPHMMHFG